MAKKANDAEEEPNCMAIRLASGKSWTAVGHEPWPVWLLRLKMQNPLNHLFVALIDSAGAGRILEDSYEYREGGSMERPRELTALLLTPMLSMSNSAAILWYPGLPEIRAVVRANGSKIRVVSCRESIETPVRATFVTENHIIATMEDDMVKVWTIADIDMPWRVKATIQVSGSVTAVREFVNL